MNYPSFLDSDWRLVFSKHNFGKRLIKSIDDGLLDRESAAHAEVCHDDECSMRLGGNCDCDPDIVIMAKQAYSTDDFEYRCSIMPDGTIRCLEN